MGGAVAAVGEAEAAMDSVGGVGEGAATSDEQAIAAASARQSLRAR